MNPIAITLLLLAAISLGGAVFLSFEAIEAEAAIRADRRPENFVLAMLVALASFGGPAVFAMGSA